MSVYQHFVLSMLQVLFVVKELFSKRLLAGGEQLQYACSARARRWPR